ncbi:MAG TPA: metalloregulator ArsR/SmtB family transcription factor [Candidatus Acidoferrum sp.]|nr:metalloregulator ArsR/SmtB family transcription factor [Candidatus Acidoferrum sp.]
MQHLPLTLVSQATPNNYLVAGFQYPPALSEAQAEELARLFKALGDPVRLLLLSILIAHKEQTKLDQIYVFKLVEAFLLAQPTISHHLRILRNAGLVQRRKRGLFAQYYVNEEKVHAAFQMVGAALGVNSLFATTGEAIKA